MDYGEKFPNYYYIGPYASYPIPSGLPPGFPGHGTPANGISHYRNNWFTTTPGSTYPTCTPKSTGETTSLTYFPTTGNIDTRNLVQL